MKCLWILTVLTALGFVLASTYAAEQHVVVQKNKMFAVAEINIRPRDSVLFKNEDDVVHNVFSSSPAAQFNLKMQQPGETASQSFKHEAAVEVRCVVHPGMKLIVNVTK